MKGNDGSSIVLDPIDFVWNAAKVTPRNGDYRSGQKGALVELFQWPHKDIEQECAELAKLGYLGENLCPFHVCREGLGAYSIV